VREFVEPMVDGMSIETFVLYPEGQEGRSRAEYADV
jgi:hypothetical protein